MANRLSLMFSEIGFRTKIFPNLEVMSEALKLRALWLFKHSGRLDTSDIELGLKRCRDLLKYLKLCRDLLKVFTYFGFVTFHRNE